MFGLWFCSMNAFTTFTSPSKVPSACLWFCGMNVNVFTSFTSPSKVPSACLWFCSMNAFTSFTSQPKISQMSVFDFVAWMCLQVLQVPPKSKVPVFDFVAWVTVTSFTSQSKMSQMSYRIKNLNSTSNFPLQKQKPIHVGQQGFQGNCNYPLQNQGSPLSPSLATTKLRSEGMTPRSMLLLQNQRP